MLDQYVDPINDVLVHYDINNKRRIAGFLSQTAHESAGFSRIKENLNYSESGLLSTFKKYFDAKTAKEYAHNKVRIASRVYANRMGNGDEASGDGYAFRGRGLIQLTGRNNYTKLATAFELSMGDMIAYMETPAGAAASAGWFWDTNDLNEYCDKDDFIGLTKRINGGTNGLAERQHYYNLLLNINNLPG